MKVKIYDKYRFAVPVYGNVVKGGSRTDGGEGLEVQLTTTNNPNYPVGSNIWVHRAQCRVVFDVSSICDQQEKLK